MNINIADTTQSREEAAALLATEIIERKITEGDKINIIKGQYQGREIPIRARIGIKIVSMIMLKMIGDLQEGSMIIGKKLSTEDHLLLKKEKETMTEEQVEMIAVTMKAGIIENVITKKMIEEETEDTAVHPQVVAKAHHQGITKKNIDIHQSKATGGKKGEMTEEMTGEKTGETKEEMKGGKIKEMTEGKIKGAKSIIILEISDRVIRPSQTCIVMMTREEKNEKRIQK